jgi:hypothetical protein
MGKEDEYCFRLLKKLAAEERAKLVDTRFLGCVLTDFSVDAGGRDEDRIYASSPYFRKTIRRGNTILHVLSTSSTKDYFQVARRGLPKFFDLRL